MSVTAKLNYLRIAPRKVRLVADLIRGKKADKAQTILSFTTKKTAGVLLKLLKQAMANAKNNFQLDESNLYISKIIVNEGPKLKRFRARARGMAYEIQKKTSHITLILDEIKEKQEKAGGGGKTRLRTISKPVEKITTEKEDIGKTPRTKKLKFKPEIEISKPKPERGIRKIFRRQTF